MKRNYCVDFLKLVFAVCIALGHYGVNIFSETIVYCFFIMSGYFLVQSFDSGKYTDGFSYSKARIKRIYPFYLIAFLILVLAMTFYAFKDGEGISYFYHAIISCLPELTFTQSIGIYASGINYPLWQMSTLIIASHILYSLMCFDRKLTTNVLSPIIVILGGAYFANAYGTHEIQYWGLLGSFVSAPLLRAFTGLCIGVSLYEFLKCVVNNLENKSGIFTTILSVFGIFYFAANCRLGNTFQNVISFILIFATCLCSKGILSFLFNKKIFKVCEKLSLSIYVNHALIINVSKFITGNRINERVAVCIYIVLLIVYAVVFMKVIDFVTAKITKKC